MPDWSYHPLKKLVLDKMSAKTSREFIHHAMSSIASIPGGRQLIGFLGHMHPPWELRKEINDTIFPSPIGLSGHIDPRISGIRAFQEVGFGFLEIGPIVLNEPKEQKEPRKEKGHILFAENLEKVPVDRVVKKLTSLDMRIPVLARIDAQVNKNEWDMIVYHLTPYVDAFIVTKEQMKSFVDDRTSGLGRAFYVAVQADGRHTENIPPHVGGIVLDAPHHEQAGYWYEAKEANCRLAQAVKETKNMYPELPVITSGGVETPNDARSLFEAGTDLILLTEGYVKAGPGLTKRIHERTMYDNRLPIKEQRWAWSFLFGLAILLGGMIALYFAFTSIILPYDEAFLGISRAEIYQVNPLILSFMSHDRMALAGTMISGGILYIQLARHGIRVGMHWAKIAFHSAGIVGFLGIFLFIGFGYFDWLHGLFWLILLPVYYLSFKEGKSVKGSPRSHDGPNDRAWQLGVYGQLLFVVLGFMIMVGGIVISTIGVSDVFVDTDLSFLCMTPEMLDNVNRNLIPVIAHDRAGFGSALVSVGLLVLMLSLWGFKKGERWVWNTIALGALPAFVAGIGTHLYIGYTDFIHLLPVYFLVFLYVAGLLLSYRFLKRT